MCRDKVEFYRLYTEFSASKLSKVPMEQEDDRISQLPDAIVHQIISLLDLKNAVQTSVLSRRWKHTWSSCLQDLDFDFRSLAYFCNVRVWDSNYNIKFLPRFASFVTRFLLQRDDSFLVRKFRLCSDLTSTGSVFVEKCINYALSHGAQELDLDVYCHPTPVNFPSEFFACKTLRTLKLKQYANGSLVIPKPFVLPKVTTLQLECFQFTDNGDLYSFSKEPFSGFPCLEKLTLNCTDLDGLIICGSKLEILEITSRDAFFSSQKSIERISAPVLTSFRYQGCVSLVCHVVDLPCLEEVYVDIFALLESPYTDDIERKMSLNMIMMLRQLGNTKIVTLTTNTIEVLAMDTNLLVRHPYPFLRTKHLKLEKGGYEPEPNVLENVISYLTRGTSQYENSMML